MTRLSRRLERELRALCGAGILAGGLAGEKARAVLQQLNVRPRAPPPANADAEQLALWHPVAGTPWRLKLADMVRCPHFGSTCPVRVCIERQAARWPGRNRMKDGSTRLKRASIYDYCGSGECVFGKAYAQAVNEGFQPPAYKTYRPDTKIQRAKRRQWIRGRTEGEVPTIDHPPGGSDRAAPIDLADPDVRTIVNAKEN